jgi:hypothetical protein
MLQDAAVLGLKFDGESFDCRSKISFLADRSGAGEQAQSFPIE